MGAEAELLRDYTATCKPELLAELVRRHSGMVYGTCLRILGDAQDAEDVAQECFLELARKADIVSSVPGWLHRTAVHRSLDSIRKTATRRQHEQQAAARGEPEPARQPDWLAILPYVDEAERLPAKLRDPLLLFYLEDWTQEQIAENLGIDQSTVSRRVRKGVEKLRKRLKDHGIAVPATVLASLLTHNAAVGAPQTLAATLGSAALCEVTHAAGAGSVAAAAAAGTGGAAAGKLAAVVGGAVAISALVAGTVLLNDNAPLSSPVPRSASEQQVAELPEPPVEHYGPRTFNSHLALKLHVDGKGNPGFTPAEEPLKIPRCTLWWVSPMHGKQELDWQSLAIDIREKEIPGLGDCTYATDEKIAHLSGAVNLRFLEMNRSSVTNSGLARLQGLTNLRRLELRGTDITGAGLVYLKDLKMLQHLRLAETRIEDAGVSHLAGLRNLRILSLSDTLITDAGLAHLKNLTRLRELNLSQTRVGNDGTAHLAGLKELRTLMLAETQVGDAGLVYLEGLTNLQKLNLDYTGLTDAGLSHLNGLSTLKALALGNTAVTDKGMAHLSQLHQLRRLSLDGTEVGDGVLRQLGGVMKNLRALNLSGTNITDQGLRAFRPTDVEGSTTKNEQSGAGNLSYLNLRDTQITDAGLPHLRELPNLEYLILSGTDITDKGLKHLGALPSLKHVFVRDSAVTARAAKKRSSEAGLLIMY